MGFCVSCRGFIDGTEPLCAACRGGIGGPGDDGGSPPGVGTPPEPTTTETAINPAASGLIPA